MIEAKCPDCGAGFKPKPFNRYGWFYAECGRRWHPKRGWEPMAPRGCLRRQRDQLRAVVSMLPVKRILAACKLIDAADNRAMAPDDSPVPPTVSVMSAKELQTCLTALWKTRAAAKAAKERSDG